MPSSAFATVGAIKECFLFNYSVPAERVRHLVPPPFGLITHHGCAFWNVLAADYRQTRPWPLPRWLGISHSCVSYRLLVSYEPPGCRSVTGLYTIRSDSSSRTRAFYGRLFSARNFHHGCVSWETNGSACRLEVKRTARSQADADVAVDISQAWAQLPSGSRIADFETANELLNISPANLAYDQRRQEIQLMRLSCDGVEWKPQPVHVLEARWNYLQDSQRGGDAIRPEPAFRIGPIPCCWQERERFALSIIGVMPGPLSAMPLAGNNGVQAIRQGKTPVLPAV